MNKNQNQNAVFADYIAAKKKFLRRQIWLSSATENLINWLQVILNFIILILAVIAIWWAVDISKGKSILPFLEQYRDKLSYEGFVYTIVVASFMILLFVLSVFIAGYKMAMKWDSYRRIMNELQAIVLFKKDDTNYTLENFEQDYDKLVKTYLTKAKVPWLQLLRNALKGDRGVK
ncbi:hypothetical protein [Mycoplasmoides fastidiosum]|nr:hypothetical protein [Mycoplasmoides fastidiosum]UUD37529.1 hypothetical protein NPA10_03100 [Mycoplasmoides fastidiosum]